jgi:hypothetical protein
MVLFVALFVYLCREKPVPIFVLILPDEAPENSYNFERQTGQKQQAIVVYPVLHRREDQLVVLRDFRCRKQLGC